MRYYNQTTFKPAIAGYVAGFVALGILYVYGFGIERFRPETIRDTMLSQGYWGPALYILANIVRPLFFFPAMVLAVAGGLAFGPLWGAVYLVIGTVLGAALCFGLARLLGLDRLRRYWPSWMPLEELDNQAARHGFRTILLLRLAPVFPWDAVSFLAGISSVRFTPYLAATFVGSVPGAIAFSYFGNAMFESVPMAVLAGAVILIGTLYLRVLSRKG
jgi:uncharacterized membrane protein YdjX (TVP38/TMEM64 family)